PDKTFSPNKNITRAEAMTLINAVLDRIVEKENIHKDAKQWPDIKKNDWYYEEVLEATNSHDYKIEDEKEEWLKIKANKIWP
ncbi:MAG TPA: S-layer homology domain-containing protein, partial [Clostridiales bacterium]|nr:S-layer homology domain-containing protein [Clostridiales bacterium]